MATSDHFFDKCNKKIWQVNNQIILIIIKSNSTRNLKTTKLEKLLPCFLKWLNLLHCNKLQASNALQYWFKIFSGTTRIKHHQNDVCFFQIICRSLEIKHYFKIWLNNNCLREIFADFFFRIEVRINTYKYTELKNKSKN